MHLATSINPGTDMTKRKKKSILNSPTSSSYKRQLSYLYTV